ncbi:hypothetical protein [Synechococcus sp. 1G10]|uniref:hypothetical protein n=1 Tax=Synechococcus sp. 1G10 TaxID=2025605 RepID=UPI001303D229|nr:hypothetical protein [Synechococcus sp. 1G10]
MSADNEVDLRQGTWRGTDGIRLYGQHGIHAPHQQVGHLLLAQFAELCKAI